MRHLVHSAHWAVNGLTWMSTIVSLCNCLSDAQRASINLGSFANPAADVRPRFRYWLPDASVVVDTVVADIAAAGAVGAGGIELLPFFEYGGELGPQPAGANWSAYNFGTPFYRNIFAAALTAHEQYGLEMDFALGPNQGQGVPANCDDLVPEDGAFLGTIPGWGTGELVSIVSALVRSNTTITYEADGSVGAQNVTYDKYVLTAESMLDLTKQVSADGIVDLSFPRKQEGNHYRIFSFYQKLSGNKNLQSTSQGSNSIFGNGSYVVDHFDGKGAKVVINFWEEHILDDEIREQLRRVGHYAWEDSPELLANISWSHSLPMRFQKLFDYDIKPFLPLLTFQQNNLAVQTTKPGSFQCVFDTEDQGIEHVNNFRAALLEGYQEYLQTLSTWLHELGVQLSVQPAYGLPLDMQALIPHVDVPECESLTFLDLVDSYRQFVGPANLAQKNVISNEVGAVRWSAFRYHLPELIFSVNRGFASGLNQYVIHGQAYSGNYYETTWPGHTPFNYLFSEPWSPREPVWGYGLRETLNYIARVQHVQQTGVPKVDIAIYNKESATSIRTVYNSTDLVRGGPENLGSSQAIVENGVLAPAGSAWRAFAVGSTADISLSAIAALQGFANSGLPIMFVGGLPKLYPSSNDTSLSTFEEQMAALQASKGVYVVGEGQLAEKLSEIGLSPRAATTNNGTWYTTWRESSDAGYALIYADLVGGKGEVIVSDTRTPIFLNPWTGEQTPVLIYEQNGNSTVIPLNLAGNQTVIISFVHTENFSAASPYHITSAPAEVIGAHFNLDTGLILHVSATNKNVEAIMSNNITCALHSSGVPTAIELQEWGLIAEHWEAPSNISDVMQPTRKYNTTHSLPSLSSWAKIPALVNTSGIGYYHSTFVWPSNMTNSELSEIGAYISFENVLHSLRVQINGNALPPLDLTHAVAEISHYLQPGKNTVTAIVATTWWNYLRTIINTIKSSEVAPLPLKLQTLLGLPLPSFTDEGLMPGVRIIPFKKVTC